MQSAPEGIDAPPRERIFNAPAAAVLLAASMPALFLLQLRLPDQGLSFAFRPASLLDGDWWPGVVGAMLLHSGWAHVAMNALGALCFGPPVARLFAGPRGAAVFFGFYIMCGVAASLGYALVHLSSHDPMVGASGAVSGLLGAAIRLLGRRSGVLRPLTDRRVLTISAVIFAINAATGLIGFAPGVEGARIAWEAHAAGFLVGLLAIGPLVRLFGRRPS